MPYPTNIPAEIPFHHQGTKSSSGQQTTSGANQEFDFALTPLNSLEVTAGAVPIHIKINAETNTHRIPSNGSITFDAMLITKLTIVESGVVYEYTGLYYQDLT
jgi:hypothetical protein